MHGIQIFWKKSRIFKIVAVIVSVPVLFFALLLLPALPAEASSYIPSGPSDFNFVDLSNISNGRVLEYNFKPTGVFDEQNQYYNLDYDSANDVYSLSVAPNSAIVYVQYTGNVSIRSVYTSTEMVAGYSTALFWGRENFSLSFSSSANNVQLTRVVADSIECSSNYNLNIAPHLYFQNGTTCNFDAYIGSTYTESFNDVEITYNIKFTGMVVSNSSSNVNSVIHNINSSSISASLANGSSDVRWAVSEYSLYEILNTYDAKLYNIWVTDNLIYDQLRLNGASNNFANTVNSELIRDAAQAHADAQNLDNHLMNDSSGWSGTTDNFNFQVQAAQASAGSAVDNAVHDYSVELAEVSDYDAVGFFRDQALASTFWRDIGEYILNRNNLGYFAVGLVVVTIIGLFVFLLRL